MNKLLPKEAAGAGGGAEASTAAFPVWCQAWGLCQVQAVVPPVGSHGQQVCSSCSPLLSSPPCPGRPHNALQHVLLLLPVYKTLSPHKILQCR